ncbi:MAG: hypothetical protein HC882_09885 [Acidobacteria bacterium]|nr:hypothetical protein [Acidobacteriota bacterium]
MQKIDQEGRSLRTILQDDYGIFTRRANRRNKRARLMSLNSRILKGHYKVFKSCTTLLAEIPRWNWDESSAKLTSGPDDLCDCWTYIDNTNPHESIPSLENERSAIYIPGDEEDQPAWAAVREMREKDKWRYLAHHGMKPI